MDPPGFSFSAISPTLYSCYASLIFQAARTLDSRLPGDVGLVVPKQAAVLLRRGPGAAAWVLPGVEMDVTPHELTVEGSKGSTSMGTNTNTNMGTIDSRIAARLAEPWDFSKRFPQPLQSALEAGLLGTDPVGEADVAAIHDELAREALSLLAELDHAIESIRAGLDPRTGKPPKTDARRDKFSRQLDFVPDAGSGTSRSSGRGADRVSGRGRTHVGPYVTHVARPASGRRPALAWSLLLASPADQGQP